MQEREREFDIFPCVSRSRLNTNRILRYAPLDEKSEKCFSFNYSTMAIDATRRNYQWREPLMVPLDRDLNRLNLISPKNNMSRLYPNRRDGFNISESGD